MENFTLLTFLRSFYCHSEGASCHEMKRERVPSVRSHSRRVQSPFHPHRYGHARVIIAARRIETI
jgi:hypothetical protein